VSVFIFSCPNRRAGLNKEQITDNVIIFFIFSNSINTKIYVDG